MNAPAWKVDDLDGDLNRLNDLIGVICELQFDLRVDEKDRRVDNLLWIAREMSGGILEHQNRKYGLRPVRMTGGERCGSSTGAK